MYPSKVELPKPSFLRGGSVLTWAVEIVKRRGLSAEAPLSLQAARRREL